jgi:monofunctional biosynthetic peptidoglycan transglycosylase
MAQTSRARFKTTARRKPRPRWWKWLKITIVVVLGLSILYQAWVVFSIFRYRSSNPSSTAMMEQRASQARDRGDEVKRVQTWVPYDKISRNLSRAVLAGEDSRFFDHAGFDWEEIRKALEEDWNEGEFKRGASTITQQLAKNLFLSTSKNPLNGSWASGAYWRSI